MIDLFKTMGICLIFCVCFCSFLTSTHISGFNIHLTPIRAVKIQCKLVNQLCMHIGHDHSHGHSHNENENSAFSRFGQLIQPRPQARLNLLVSAAIVLIPALIRKKITKLDFGFFVIVSSILTCFGSAKHAFKNWIAKINSIKNSLVKHSTPITSRYFFKNTNAADRVTLLGVVINILLSLSKFVGGIAFNSAVLVADAGHSLSDLLSDFICLWAVQVARLPADEDHPFGHGKFESVGSLFLSLTLLATGLSIGAWSYDKMLKVLQNQALMARTTSVPASVLRLPSWPALVLAFASIASKEWLFQVTKKVGEALRSQIIIANAWHHRSDAASSVLSFGSIAVAMTMPQLLAIDSAAGIFVAGMICLTGIDVLIESVKELTDTNDNSISKEVADLILTVDGVLGVKALRSRTVGSGKSLLELTIMTDKMNSFSASQSIAEKSKWKIMGAYPNIIEVVVRTTTSDELPFCPLLGVGQISPIEAEDTIRKIVVEEQAKGNMKTLIDLTRVTIHYVRTALLHVDCYIKMESSANIDAADKLAQEIRHTLLAANAAQSINVFLDLFGNGVYEKSNVKSQMDGVLVGNAGLYLVEENKK